MKWTDPRAERSQRRNYRTLVLLVILLSMAGCGGVRDRIDRARQVAKNAGFGAAQVLRGGAFSLLTYQRLGRSNGLLRVYIEGDGFAWINRGRISPDPTPRNPLALRLATSDPSSAVVYIGRPCQYIGVGSNPRCNGRYWTSHRFAPEVIEATSAVIDQVKRKADAKAIELVGFSGGGAVAVLVASRRSDVVGIRTVAGNLDHVALNRRKKVTPLTGSLNAADFSAKVSGIPQIHYVGEDDEIVGRYVAESYRSRAGRTGCIAIRTVPGVSHTGGWVSKWRRLLAQQLPKCNIAPIDPP